MENYFLLFLAGIVVAWVLWDRRQMKNSPYYRTLAEVRKRLEFAEFSGQSLEAQEWRAKLAWMDAILLSKLGDIEKSKAQDYHRDLANLRPEQIAFPKTLEMRQREHAEYAEILVQALAGLFTSDDTRHYRSTEELPYPISEILKAVDAILRHIARVEVDEGGTFPAEYVSSVKALAMSLQWRFLPLPKEAIACTGRENMRVGRDYLYESKADRSGDIPDSATREASDMSQDPKS
jgi:hypothetical protein